MFFSTLQNMISHVHVACAPNRGALLDAFDALKESSKALFVSQPSRHIPLTSSATVLTLPNASDVEANVIVAMPHVSGVATVASVGLHHLIPCHQWFLKLLREVTNSDLSLPIPSTLDLSIDEDAPRSNPSFPITISSPSWSSVASSPSSTGLQLQNNRVSVGVQVSFPSSWSCGPSPSSLDSGPSFECLTPFTTDTAVFYGLQKPQVATSSNPLPLDVPFTRKHSAAHLDLDEAIRTLSDKASNLVEQYEKAVACAKRLCELQVDLEDEASILFHSGKGGGLDALTEGSDPTPSTVNPTAFADVPACAEGHVAEDNPSHTELEADSADADNETVAEDDSEASSEDAGTDDVVAPRSLYNPYSTRNYRVHGLIGEGGFARVAQVEDDNGRFFAVKVHHKKVVYQRPNARSRLLREMQTMASVTGFRCLVHLEESWEDADNIYFVMPLCRATLMDYLDWKARTGLADPVSERRYCAEMVAAVALLHERGIMHRDIKPENFLLDESGACVLADYGLAYSLRGKHITSLRSAEICGTQDYLAPEQCQGYEYDYKVDIWELGCVWIELLAKSKCSWTSEFGDDFFERMPQVVIQARLQESVMTKFSGHPALNLLLWMVDVDPRNRPNTGRIIDDPWFSDINWPEILYGSSYTHPYLPGYAGPISTSSHRYSTFDATKSPSLVLKSLLKKRFTEREQQIAVLQTVQDQTDLFDTYPEDFVYPPPIRHA